MADAPPRLDIVFPKYDPPLFFVTFNTHHRKKLLANALVHNRFVEFVEKGQQQGIAVGRYVIMPDHMHLFVSGGQRLPVDTMDTASETQFVDSDFTSAASLAEKFFRSFDSTRRELRRKMRVCATESCSRRTGLKL